MAYKTTQESRLSEEYLIGDLPKEDVGFLEETVTEFQSGRLSKRHASATDHADNMGH